MFRRRRKAASGATTIDATKCAELVTDIIPRQEIRERPLSVKLLGDAKDTVSRVIFLAEQKLLVAVSADHVVCVYNVESASGAPRTAFRRHSRWVRDVVQLNDDLLASVGYDFHLYTWHASTGEKVDQWIHKTYLTTVKKLDDEHLVIGDTSGRVIILRHNMGRSFQVLRLLDKSHNGGINDIVIEGGLLLTCSHDGTAKLWDTTSFNLLTTLRHSEGVNSAAITDMYIVTACADGKVYVYDPANGYMLDFVLRASEFGLETVAFLTQDCVAVGGFDEHLSFVSLSSKSLLSQTKLTSGVSSFVVLSDGRLAVSGYNGYCAILVPPESVRDLIDDCATTLYPYSAHAVARTKSHRSTDSPVLLDEARKTVEDAKSSTVATMEELREKLLIVAEMRAVDDEMSENVVMKDVYEEVQATDDETRIESAAFPTGKVMERIVVPLAEQSSSSDVVPSTMVADTSVAPVDISNELKEWQEKGVSKDSVRPLDSEQVGACVAAYLVNYEPKLSGIYKECKDLLAAHFGQSCVFGETFTDADEEDRKALPDAVMLGLAEVTEEKSLVCRRMRVKNFVRLASS